MRIGRISSVLLTLAGLTACQQPETAEQMHARLQAEAEAARTAIRAEMDRFATAFNERQANAMATAYASDAVVMPPDMPAVSGQDAIRTMFAAMFPTMPEGTTIAFRIEAVTANGPIAVERGVWTMTLPTPDGGTTEMVGKYLAEWREIDGKWVMVSDIWNNDAPVPPMEPAGM